MAEIFGYPIMGGGGSDLNFKVIAVTSESALPSSAAENTIAVITTTAITSYVFASTAPASPVEGMVWLVTGTASTIGFNAIKKNGLWVYPTGCQQYVSGAWAEKQIMGYLNGSWERTDIWILKDGVINTEITGGFNFGNNAQFANGLLKISYSGNRGGDYTSKSLIDLTNYSTLTARVKQTSRYATIYGFKLGIDKLASNISSMNPTVGTQVQDVTADYIDVNVDISGITGAYYVGAAGVCTADTISIRLLSAGGGS